MATDFTNNNTTISTSGAFQPKTKNTPLDIRTRVNLKADIDSIPNPFVGMKIIVLQDETNDNQMTEYVVISLKANSLGAANSKVDEVVLAKDFLGVNGNGIGEEQSQQLNTAYTHSQSTHVQQSDIPTKTSQLQNDSGYLTEVPSEYITETELNAKGYLTEHQSLDNYALKSEIPTVPTKISQLQNDSNFISSIPEEYVTEQELAAKGLATETFVTNKIAEAQLGGDSDEIDLSGYQTKEDLTLETTNKTIVGAINELKTNSHTHTNKNILDTITTEKIANWNNKAEVSDIPTKTSDLVNDSGFLTSIPNEYITETELDAKGYLTEHQDISGKVDKINGKGLSTNDYTTAEKNKLNGIEENANNYSLPIASNTVLGGIKVGSGLSIDSNGVLSSSDGSSDLSNYQTKTDNTLTTTDKTIVGAINELDIESIKAEDYTENSTIQISSITKNGTTSARPTNNLYIGLMYFDTTLNKPIWYNGSTWVDANGTTV